MESDFLIVAIVDNRIGVLHKIASMFSRRGFNIETISAGEINVPSLVRITITMKSDKNTADQLIKQMEKLIDIVSVTVLDPEKAVERELALIKVRIDTPDDRSAIMDYANIFRGRVVDVAPKSVIVEITGTPQKMNAFIELASTFGILEIARTGITALSRGKESIPIEAENLGE
jgi:acetolactate synthase-1/3 small subunit